MKSFNPFSKLDREQLQTVIHNRLLAKTSEGRLKLVIEAYRNLLHDDRYKVIKKQLSEVLGEQIDTLVLEASKCPKCSPFAERVRLLHDVVDQASQTVWMASHQERLEEIASTEGDNGRGV